MNLLRALQHAVLVPDTSETLLETRGFHVKNAGARELLERIGATFLAGYRFALDARDPADARAPLEALPERFRGFAYEGAGMGFAVLDALPVGRSDRVARFLQGAGAPHVYMVYVGVGWAMARVPRFTWSRLHAPDPLLRWLVLDGYGFHQAYFKTARFVHQQEVEPGFPWPRDDRTGYARQAIDQGIGRAIWFVGGTAPDVVADLIDAFPRARRGDLYSGAGLAATYAGGVDEAELTRFRERAGEHRPAVAQAAAFAAEARVRAGLLGPHTELAARVLAGTDAVSAAQLTQQVRPAHPVDGELPAFEQWRREIAQAFVTMGRSQS
ncbi:MAG: DUF1702 family protein [Actinomycetes bacterium]